MNYRLPNPLGDKYRENFDTTFKRKSGLRTHLKINERNGTPVVLCNLEAEAIWKVTLNKEEVNCKHCLGRMK